MTEDIIERAEAAQNKCLDPDTKLLLAGLVEALKAARAQRDEFRAQLEYEQQQQFGFGSMYSGGSDV